MAAAAPLYTLHTSRQRELTVQYAARVSPAPSAFLQMQQRLRRQLPEHLSCLQVKLDVERAYLAALAKPYLATEYARLKEALRDFARLYPRAPGDRRAIAEDERIERERASRWSAAPPQPVYQPPAPPIVQRPLPVLPPPAPVNRGHISPPAQPPPAPAQPANRYDEPIYDFGQFGVR
jgi:hypothetical protein